MGKKSRSIFRFIFKIILIICAIPLLLCYISIFINPEIVPVFSVFGPYFIPIVIINIIMLIIAAIMRTSAFWITFVMLIPSLFFVDSYIQFGKNEREDEEGLKLMTYNVGNFSSSQEGRTYNETLEDIGDFISEKGPDIVAMQEFYVSDTTNLKKSFPGYPYIQKFLVYNPDGKYFVGNVIFSKYPIIDGDEMEFEDSGNKAVYADIVIHGKEIRLYNLHLQSNHVSLESILDKLSNDYDGFSDEFADAHVKVKDSSPKRIKQVKYILDHIDNCKTDVMLCGDFNDTPVSYSVQKLGRGRKDSFAEGGNGWGATYSILWPLLRIDYVFVPKDWEVLKHETLKVKYSDHYPVMTKIDIDYDRQEQSI